MHISEFRERDNQGKGQTALSSMRMQQISRHEVSIALRIKHVDDLECKYWSLEHVPVL